MRKGVKEVLRDFRFFFYEINDDPSVAIIEIALWQSVSESETSPSGNPENASEVLADTREAVACSSVNPRERR